MFIQQHNFGTNLELKCGHTDGIHNSGDHLHQFFEFAPPPPADDITSVLFRVRDK